MRFIVVVAAAAALFGQDRRHVTEPVIPEACTHLRAVPGASESKLDTTRIQAAIDSCAAGKAVVLQAGGEANSFVSGALKLRSGVTLVVDTGARLLASRNPADFEVSPGSCGIVDDNGRGCRPLIGGDGIADSGVMGGGIIDGRGGDKLLNRDVSWWDLAEQARPGNRHQNCPRLVVINNGRNFTLYRITLRNSPNFHVLFNGEGFTAWGVTVNSPKKSRNTDGIDPSSATDVTITHCFIHAGDDQVAIKAGSKGPSSHMTIAHNHFYTGHGMSIGSETNGGASAIRVNDLTIDGADNGIRIKSNASRGGLVQDVVYEDVCIRDTRIPIFMDSNYTFSGARRDLLPQFTGIVLRNVDVAGGGKIRLDGYDEAHRLGMTFDGVTLEDRGAVEVTAKHAAIRLGPGPVNFMPRGPDVQVTGRATSAPDERTPACREKFVPFADGDKEQARVPAVPEPAS